MTVPILDKGFVALDEAMGDDLSVVNSARVSVGKHVTEMGEADEKLVGFLMKNRHGTPFEHNSFRWHVKCPIFVAREWQRHRIGSFNEISGRYAELPGDFYIPAEEDVRTQVGKPGAYTYEQAPQLQAEWFVASLSIHCDVAYKLYQRALKLGVAREQARLFLPVNIYTEFYWTVNARSLMNFLNLRTAPSAMWEIRQYADAIEKLWAEKMPVTHAAWMENGKLAP